MYRDGNGNGSALDHEAAILAIDAMLGAQANQDFAEGGVADPECFTQSVATERMIGAGQCRQEATGEIGRGLQVVRLEIDHAQMRRGPAVEFERVRRRGRSSAMLGGQNELLLAAAQ